MNKRILSILLCLMLVASLLVLAVPVNAIMPSHNVELKVTADKTNAKPGDTITFTVTMGPVEALGTLQMVMDIPTGLTYVPKSGTTINKAELGFDDIAFTDESLMINGVRSEYEEDGVKTGGYVSTTDTTIGSYQVTVDDNAAAGDYTVSLTNLEFYDCLDWEDATSLYYVTPAVVTIGASEDATEAATEAATEVVTPTEDATQAAGDPTEVVTPTEGATEAATQAATQAATTPASKDQSTKDSSNKTTTSPKTGDSTNMYLWMLIMLASMVGAGAVLYTAKRKGIFTK